MKVYGNLIIFSTDNEERKDVRRLKEKKLQVVLDEKNNLESFKNRIFEIKYWIFIGIQ